MGDPLLMARSWRWLQTRIVGLLDAPISHDMTGSPIFASRLQAAICAPKH